MFKLLLWVCVVHFSPSCNWAERYHAVCVTRCGWHAKNKIYFKINPHALSTRHSSLLNLTLAYSLPPPCAPTNPASIAASRTFACLRPLARGVPQTLCAPSPRPSSPASVASSRGSRCPRCPCRVPANALKVSWELCITR